MCVLHFLFVLLNLLIIIQIGDSHELNHPKVHIAFLNSTTFKIFFCTQGPEKLKICNTKILLGQLISEEEAFWDTVNFNDRDIWFLYNLQQNYPYLSSYNDADIVVICLKTFITRKDFFFDEVFNLYPLLLSKPHVIILSNSIAESIALNHPNAKYFHYITHATLFWKQTPPLNNVNVTISPYLWRKHFTENYVNHFIPKNVRQKKRYLLTCSWKPRESVPTRVVWMNDCIKSPLCFWLQWDALNSWDANFSSIENLENSKNLALQSLKAINQSWYTMLPLGDNCVRNSMFDSFQLDSISIIPEECVMMLPFREIINYNPFIFPISNSTDVNIIQLIKSQFNETRVLHGLHHLSKVRHVLQYRLKPNLQTITYDKLSTIEILDDAMSFTLKRMISDLCKNGRLNKCL